MALMSSGGMLQGRHDGHARILPSLQDDRSDELAGLVVQHELRPQQVRSTLVSAAQVATVTGPAVDPIEPVAALDHLGIARWPLLGGKGRRSSASPLRRGAGALRRTSAGGAGWRSWGRLRRRGLRAQPNRERRQQEEGGWRQECLRSHRLTSTIGQQMEGPAMIRGFVANVYTGVELGELSAFAVRNRWPTHRGRPTS